MNELSTVSETNDLYAASTFNAQASLSFTLLKTNLTMAFAKVGNQNTFVILPINNASNEGMPIKDMIRDINKLIKDGSPKTTTDVINVSDVTNAVKDVNTATDTHGVHSENDGLSDIKYDEIKVCLKQAFLLLATDQAVEYALEIDVMLDGLFPKDVSFINVEKLTLAIWNTDRKKIIDEMNIVDIKKLLDEKI